MLSEVSTLVFFTGIINFNFWALKMFTVASNSGGQGGDRPIGTPQEPLMRKDRLSL